MGAGDAGSEIEMVEEEEEEVEESEPLGDPAPRGDRNIFWFPVEGVSAVLGAMLGIKGGWAEGEAEFDEGGTGFIDRPWKDERF